MIIEMKKAKIIILKETKDDVIKELQKSGLLMIIKQAESANDTTTSYDGLIQRTDQAIKVVNKYRDKKPLFGDYNETTYDNLMHEDKSTKENIKVIESLVDEKNKLISDKKSLGENIKNYLPWENLDIPLSELHNTIYTRLHVGFIEKRKIDDFKALLDDEGCNYQILETVRNVVAVYYQTYYEDDERISSQIKNWGFNDVTLPSNNLTMANYLTKLNDEYADFDKKIEEVDKKLKDFVKDIPSLEIYADHLLNKKALIETDYASTKELYVIDGWVRSDKTVELEKTIEFATPFYDVEYSVPSDEEVPPTCTVNNDFVSPFEGITNMFSVPNAHEADPNPVMSVWYWLLFGMMMGDAGYGLVLLIVCILALKFVKPRGSTKNLIKILMYSSLPTILWGIFFNSYFGASLPFYKAPINPMQDPMPMLVLSVVVGAFHIITALVLRAIKDIKAHDPFIMLAKDASWILIILGIGFFAGSKAIDLKSATIIINYIGLGMIALGVLFILLFSGHHKKNIIAKGGAGLLGLYDVTGYLGDLLSYTRIMALVMSSAAVAQVMNQLAGMVQGSPIGFIFSILIYIIGHVFNMMLGLLSAYVHDCRLQYIEFYGKFYDGGGYEFKPLSLQTKYVNEIKK